MIENDAPNLTGPEAATARPSSRPTGLLVVGLIVLLGAGLGYTLPSRLGATDVPPAAPAARFTLNGAGASFPYPFYARLFDEYHAFRPTVSINYAPVGSGDGVRAFVDAAADFGASDAPLPDDQLADPRGGGGDILHLPMTLGAVVPVYNLPAAAGAAGEPLVFSGPLLADIFRGAVTRWNDPAIAALNPRATLPAAPIAIVHRADDSGTTHVFADYLSKVSPPFAASVGRGQSVAWPAPDKLPARSNEGVAGIVRATPGTIGYVELIYALQNNVTYGAVINAAGRPIHATLQSVTAAAAGQPNPPADLRMSITNAPGDAAYPIAAFSYLLVRKNPPHTARAQQLVAFLNWAATDGQRYAAALHYAPLPPEIVLRNRQLIATINARPQRAGDR